MKELPLDPAAWLAAIVESSDDAIVSKTLDGTITSWNRSAERLYGYSAEEVIGRSIMLIVPSEREAEEQRILALLTRGERIDHFETERRTKDGRIVPVSLTISPVRDNDGTIVGASKVARDISERRAADAAQREASRRKDEFLAMLGHELRNPLAPILSAVDLLQRQIGTSQDPRPICAILKRQVGHMARLLDDLLDVSRFSSGKIRLRLDVVDLRDVVACALEVVRPLIDECRHTFSVSMPPQKVEVMGDETRLVQLLVNLVNNACKYTLPGDHIDIALVVTADGQAQLDVIDNGSGMKPELVRDVFELFVQGERTLDRARGGLGLGLTIVRSIAHLHGGTVEAMSDGEGAGSTFRVHIPLKSSETNDSVATSNGTAAVSTGLVGGTQGRHVVVVDDNVDHATVLAELVRYFNHTVSVTYDSQSAITTIHREKPDVAFVDIGLPEMDGLAVARTLREGGHRGLLVAVTGYGQPQDFERSYAAGFDEHWVKPVDSARLENFLTKRRH